MVMLAYKYCLENLSLKGQNVQHFRHSNANTIHSKVINHTQDYNVNENKASLCTSISSDTENTNNIFTI